MELPLFTLSRDMARTKKTQTRVVVKRPTYGQLIAARNNAIRANNFYKMILSVQNKIAKAKRTAVNRSTNQFWNHLARNGVYRNVTQPVIDTVDLAAELGNDYTRNAMAYSAVRRAHKPKHLRNG